MRPSNEVTTKVRESVQSTTPLQPSAPSVQLSTPVLPWWECDGPSGPADLYKAFAFTAVEQRLKDRGQAAEDDIFDIIFDYVEIAIDVILKAADIPESWQGQYDAVTAHLRQQEGNR